MAASNTRPSIKIEKSFSNIFMKKKKEDYLKFLRNLSLSAESQY
jgi:hypothetical protein